MGLLIKCKFKTSSVTIGTHSTVILTGGQLKIVLENIILETYSKKCITKWVYKAKHIFMISALSNRFLFGNSSTSN